MADVLTPRQDQILGALRSHCVEHGYPPTLRELCVQVGLRSSASVARQLVELEAKGYIVRTPGKPRALTILPHPDTTPDVKETPTS